MDAIKIWKTIDEEAENFADLYVLNDTNSLQEHLSFLQKICSGTGVATWIKNEINLVLAAWGDLASLSKLEKNYENLDFGETHRLHGYNLTIEKLSDVIGSLAENLEILETNEELNGIFKQLVSKILLSSKSYKVTFCH